MAEQAQSRYTIKVEVIGEQELLDFQKAADRMNASIRQINGKTQDFSRAAANSNDAIKKLGYQASQTGIQIGDFVSQVTGGIDPLRAFGQQAGQLATLFRHPYVQIGITAAAIGATLIPAIREYFADSKDAADITDDLTQALADLEDATAAASLSMSDLAEKYGENAAAAKTLLEVQLQLQRAKLADTLAATIPNLDDATRGFITAASGGRELRTTIQALSRDLGITEAEARKVNSAFIQWRNAMRTGDIETAADATVKLYTALAEMGIPLESLPKSIRDMLTELNALGLAGYAAEAGVDAATDALTRLNAQPTFKFSSKIEVDAPDLDLFSWDRFVPENVEVPVKVKPELAGGSEVDDFQRDVDSFVQSLLAYETPAQSLNRQIEELQADWREYGSAIDDAGRSQMLYNQGIADLQKELDGLESELQELGPVGDMVSDALSNMFVDFINGTKSAEDAFSDMLDYLAEEMLKFLISEAVKQFMQLLLMMATGGASAGATTGATTGILPFSATELTPTGRSSRAAPSLFESPVVPRRLGLRTVSAARTIPQANSTGTTGQTTVNIIDQAGVSTSVENSTGVNGEQQLDIILERKVQGMISSGKMDKTMQVNYGVRRRSGA